MAIFTLLHIDGSSLGDRSMLLSRGGTKRNSQKKPNIIGNSHCIQTTGVYCFSSSRLLDNLVTSSSAMSSTMRERGEEKGKERREKERKSNSHLDGFQQAHTVTRVIRRNMPPVDRMMYSELRPKPE